MKYNYIRFKWGQGLDMDAVEQDLSEKFTVSRRDFPGDSIEVSLFKEDRVELVVTADKMRIHMSAHRAILSQISDGPFTKQDMKLRDYVLEKYPRSRPTPFPWSFNIEPSFEVENE